MNKTQRQHLIARLLEDEQVTNQPQLVELLDKEGVGVNQATVSRDLEELGAIKVRVPGGETAYAIPALPKEQLAPPDHLRRVLCDWVVEVERSGDLVVLRTPPGSAHVVALGHRPEQPRRRDRHGRRRRHAAGDRRRNATVRTSLATSASSPDSDDRSRTTRRCRARVSASGRAKERSDMAKRVVLAYSGGLDTSVAVRWMIENLGVEVICLSADVGQEGTLDGNREKALGAGAIAYEELDLRDEFARDFLAPVIKANALYEGKYPLVSALSRPLIVKHQVELARRVRRRRRGPRLHRQGQRPGALRGVGHGAGARPRAASRRCATGGSPARTRSRTPPPTTSRSRATKEKLYSIDDNLWGRAIECGEMEDPWAKPPAGRVGDDAADRDRAARGRRSRSSAGVPVAVDGDGQRRCTSSS